jgi:hypothetical protein
MNTQPVRLSGKSESLVRAFFWQKSEAAMAEVSLSTGLSFPTVSRVVFQMEKNQELVEVGLGSSSGGRRARRFKYNNDFMHGAAIFLEKNETKYIIFDCKGKILKNNSYQGVLDCDGADCVEKIVTLAQDVIKADPKVLALSVGLPAAVENGRIRFIPSYEHLQQLDLRSILEQELGIAVTVENDMNASILGYLGRVRSDKKKTYAYLFLGTNGPGLGLYVNGDIVRGGSYFAGEVSFMPIYDNKNLLQSIHTPSAVTIDDKLDAVSRLVVSASALINPDYFIFSNLDLQQTQLDQIIEICSGYFPREHLPKLTASTWDKDYLEGLKILSLDLMVNTQQ